MPYKVYIKKDSKVCVRWVPDGPRPARWGRFALAGFLLAATAAGAKIITLPGDTAGQLAPLAESLPPPSLEILSPDTAPDPFLPETLPEETPALAAPAETNEPDWTTVRVGKGENLSIIFDRLGLAPTVLDAVINSGEAAKRLARLYPGQNLEFHIEDGRLLGMRFRPTVTERIEISTTDSGFVSELVEEQLDVRQALAAGEIKSSLFLAGQEAGLSDALIMQLATIYGWEIDFVLDIREGDSFRVVYEERYLDGNKVEDGPILAAQFTNQGRAYHAIRYTLSDGTTGYFSETGASMRKAFLRSPLDFTRISSNFDLRRRHPILNTIRAHRGVDYAAPTGTPVKATGDGIIDFIGTKGGYGRTVVLRHGSSYKTLYAHLSRFANGVKQGSRVRQGMVIGYVGRTGLATGPHLHYEFQVNGQHRNPLTVPLPRAEGIPEAEMARFREESAPLLAALGADLPADGTRLALGGNPGKRVR